MFNKISVIGLGYIGLPTAAMFASKKVKVIGVDRNPSVVDTINSGEIHIVEPFLDSIVKDVVNEGHLSGAITPEPADAFLIAVPTPFKKSDNSIPEPNLDFIEDAVKLIAPVLKKGDLIILESTSPVGTTEKIAEWLSNLRDDLVFPNSCNDNCDVNVAHCPERVLPGKIIKELVENDRVIGGITESCSKRAADLYKIFVKGECVLTNARTAEMSKLTENACRDVQIAFANELSMVCDNLDIDVWELISLANRHPRINILNPGPGVGGHCIAVDPWFIVSRSPDQAKLMLEARNVNILKTNWAVDKIKTALTDISTKLNKPINKLNVAYLGLAFKPNIDDLRESPALDVVNKLIDFGAQYVCVEPNIGYLTEHPLATIDEAVNNSDLIVSLVKHDQFIDRKSDILSSKSEILDFCGLNK